MVSQNQEGVVSYWGEYSGTLRTPGIHVSLPFGRNVQLISTKKISHEIPKLKIVDKNGNPLIISAVIVFSIVNTKRAVFDVDNPLRFVTTQAETVLKQIISRYPYETHDDTPCLKTEADLIGKELCSTLQEKIQVAGAYVFSYQLKEISYSPEIAAGMLKRQQAASIISARQIIVQGAVGIAADAIEQLRQRNIDMNERERAKLVTNILTVLCSDKDATPTVPLDSN
jgi:regulator of protease activity HflC (stomatin/prohibitin superfamily)